MTELDSLQNIKIESVIKSIDEISENTNIWGGFSGVVTFFAFVASLITIAGLILLIKALIEHNIDTNCRKKILLDLTRHIFTINSYAEAIRYNMATSGDGKVLREGILERFAFIDADLELSKLRFSDKSYEKLHSMQEKMRNFNSAVNIAERHFTDSCCPNDIRVEDLDDICNRSIELSNDIILYSQKAEVNLTEDEIKKYIREYYLYDSRIPKWEKEGKINRNIKPLKRDSENRSYYDSTFLLTDIYDDCIRCRINKVKFHAPYNQLYSNVSEKTITPEFTPSSVIPNNKLNHKKSSRKK